MMADTLLTVDEVAARLRVSAETVRRWLRMGKLSGYAPVSDAAGWRISEQDVERFLRTLRRGEPEV